MNQVYEIFVKNRNWRIDVCLIVEKLYSWIVLLRVNKKIKVR